MKRKFFPKKIFIVEDDPLYIKIVKYVLELDPEHEVHVFTTGKECIDHLYLNPIMITLDYTLPDMTGNDVMEAIKKYNSNIGIIVLSGQPEISVAVDFMKAGAYLYIVKDDDTKEKLLLTVQRLKKQIRLQEEETEGRTTVLLDRTAGPSCSSCHRQGNFASSTASCTDASRNHQGRNHQGRNHQGRNHQEDLHDCERCRLQGIRPLFYQGLICQPVCNCLHRHQKVHTLHPSQQWRVLP